MPPLIEIDNLGCISKETLFKEILPAYRINLVEFGIQAPCSNGLFQQYKWRFKINASLKTVRNHFRDNHIIDILNRVGKPALKQFSLYSGEIFQPGAKGRYWISKLMTIARGEFMITDKKDDDNTLRFGYIRLEDQRINPQLIGMMNLSPFGFSIFEFNAVNEAQTDGSYYIAQQLPGHPWGRLMAKILKRELKNASFHKTFKALIRQIETLS